MYIHCVYVHTVCMYVCICIDTHYDMNTHCRLLCWYECVCSYMYNVCLVQLYLSHTLLINACISMTSDLTAAEEHEEAVQWSAL